MCNGSSSAIGGKTGKVRAEVKTLPHCMPTRRFDRRRSRRRIGWLAVALCLFTSLSLAAEKAPNILFIAIDDLRPELGCYGVGEVHSPHIDKLAANGVRFDSAHCQLAVCNPSRVSMLTGLRPDSTRVWTLDVRFRETIPQAVTLPQHFKENGYTTLGYGKIFHNPWPDNVSWSEPHSWPKNSSLWSRKAKQELKRFKQKLRSEGRPQKKIDRLRARATEQVDIADSQHIDGAIADQAIAAIKRLSREEKPFFVAAGFVRPHLPFVVPKKYWDLYDPELIPLAENQSLPGNAPPFAMNTMYELRDYFDYLDTPGPRDGSLTKAQRRNLKHGYYAAISFIDAQVGRLLEALKASGQQDDTVVVLWSDHGLETWRTQQLVQTNQLRNRYPGASDHSRSTSWRQRQGIGFAGRTGRHFSNAMRARRNTGPATSRGRQLETTAG